MLKVEIQSALRESPVPPDEDESPLAKTLYRLCAREHWDYARKLLEDGVDPTTCKGGYYETSALHLIARWGDSELLKLALKNTSDINVRDKAGLTVLMEAINNGAGEDVIKDLLKAGIDVDAVSAGGYSALGHAVSHEKTIIILLVQHGATACIVNGRSISVVEYAVSIGDTELLRAVYDTGKFAHEVNQKNSRGTYPLDDTNSKAMVKLLIQAGATEWTFGNGKDYIINEEMKLAANSTVHGSYDELADIKASLNSLTKNVNNLQESLATHSSEMMKSIDERFQQLAVIIQQQRGATEVDSVTKIVDHMSRNGKIQ